MIWLEMQVFLLQNQIESITLSQKNMLKIFHLPPHIARR